MDLTPQKIEDLIQKEIEGGITQEEAAQLEKVLKQQPEIRQQLSEALWLHGQLAANSEDFKELFQKDSIANTKSFNKPLITFLALAASITLVWIGSFIQLALEPKAVATLVRAENCTWGASELPTQPNSPLPPGQLNLLSGIAVISFLNGAELVMEAPSNVELKDKMNIRLIDGSVVLDIPEQAHGFTVETREGKVVDFGTRFGVTQTEFSNPQVWVFEGEVELRSNEKNQKAHKVFGGQYAALGNAPEKFKEEIDHGQFEKARQGWITKIPFKDNYIRFDHKAIEDNSPLLMVKYSTIAPNNCRISYLSFDLSDLPLDRIQHSELTLELQPSGKGFAAQIPDCEFTLYGLANDADDDWDEQKISFQNAPAYDKKTRRLIQDQVIPLGHFQVDRGVATGLRSIRTKDLASFIKQDRNKIITLIIERDNDETGKQGLVNAFASRENPTAAPPRLHLKLNE
jgi:hypothetical protein